MNCFNHRDQPAVAVCKACGKGLCPECLAQVGSSIACKNSCEKRAAVLDSLIDARLKLLGFVRLHASGLIASGLLFLMWGLLSYSAGDAASSPFTTSLGIILLSMGIIAAMRGRRSAEAQMKNQT
jgi:hypothetical protein